MVKQTTGKKQIKYWFVDSTTIVAETAPVFAAIEVLLSGMSVTSSLYARAIGAATTYGGLGRSYALGRDKLRERGGVERQSLQDVLYTAVFNTLVSVPLYTSTQAFAGDEIDATKIMVGSIAAGAFGAINGVPVGYAIDIGRDLAGLEECNRALYPKKVKHLGSRTKEGVLGMSILLAAMSMGLTYIVASHLGEGPSKRSGSEYEGEVVLRVQDLEGLISSQA